MFVGRVGFESRALESVFYAVLVFSPILCAGLLFGSAINQSTSLARDYGTNLLGAMQQGLQHLRRALGVHPADQRHHHDPIGDRDERRGHLREPRPLRLDHLLLDRRALDHCLIAHRSVEPGHSRLLKAIGQRPLLDMDMRLGEGSGAALAVPLLKAAAACLNGMATFGEAGVSGKA